MKFADFFFVFALLAVVFIVSTPININAQNPSCNCPVLTVSASAKSFTAGSEITFRANLGGAQPESLKYNWKVKIGSIVYRSFDTIRVATKRKMAGRTLTAAVEIRGIDPSCKCQTTASSTVELTGRSRNLPANVVELTLDKYELTKPCFQDKSASSENIIDVFARAEDAENDVLIYDYTITGGRIIGVGPRVKWDLSDATAGSYLITASVDDGCGFCGRIITKTVIIRDCTPR